ncbi:hypothetical protein D3C71_1736390 [compost metagenome]
MASSPVSLSLLAVARCQEPNTAWRPSGTVAPIMYELARKPSASLNVPRFVMPSGVVPMFWPTNQPSRVWLKAAASFTTSKSYEPPTMYSWMRAEFLPPAWSLDGLKRSYEAARFSGPLTYCTPAVRARLLLPVWKPTCLESLTVSSALNE